MRGAGIWCGLLVMTLGCGGRAAPAPDPAAVRAELLAVDAEYDSATASDGLEGWVRYIADSGRQVDNHGDFVTGPAAVREHMRGLLTDTTHALRWVPDLAEVSADGNLGYTWGRWTYAAKDSAGMKQVSQGRYLTVWRRQPDGHWKVEADIGTDTDR